MPTIGFISLGCPRNLVDSEVMMGFLKKHGFSIRSPGDGVDICFVNTCSFIESARKESVETVLEAASLKKKGSVGYLVVCGCMAQMYKDHLMKEVPEIDMIIGTNDFHKLTPILEKIRSKKPFSVVTDELNYLYDEHSPRFSLTPPHYAYVKISEGCSNFCSYCIISRLRGDFRSRSISSVLGEVENLAAKDRLKEINLIGQDTTLFGIDRYGRMALSDLLRRLCRLKNSVEWIRVLYTHPAHYTDELIDTIASEDKICKYLDIPIQHISDKILKLMNRKTDRKKIESLIKNIRKKIPGLILRTSVIVGFPNETDRDFKELVSFIQDTKFDRLGAFTYSREDGTKASKMKGHVGEKIKTERLDKVMRIQQRISSDLNKRYIGNVIDVLIDEDCGKEEFAGRSRADAPEIDGNIFVKGRRVKPGNIYKVKITGAMEYDLTGEVI